MTRYRPAADRLMEKLEFDPATHCVEFTGSRHKRTGHGLFHGGVDMPGVYYAHRAAYLLWNGALPEGMDIDHRCGNPACCNPQHLWPVTHRQNILFADMRKASFQARKVTCPRGHSYDKVRPNGHRWCSICANEQQNARRRRSAA